MPEDIEQIPQDVPADVVCEGGNLDCGSGLLLIIRKAMDSVPAAACWKSAAPKSPSVKNSGMVPDDEESLSRLAANAGNRKVLRPQRRERDLRA